MRATSNKYTNSIYRTDTHRGTKIIIKANNLLILEDMLTQSLNRVKEQLKMPYSADSKLSTREVLKMNMI
jgi:hypothetical protein